MRPISAVIGVWLSACGLAQGLVVLGGSSGTSGTNGVSSINGTGQIVDGGRGPARGPLGVGSLRTTLRIDPPSGSPPRGLTTSWRGRSSPGQSYFTRTVMDSVHHEYSGYEVLLEEKQPGTYLATFEKLAVTSMETAVTAGVTLDQWSVRNLVLPEPKIVHDGDIVSIELMTDATTGQKLIDDIAIQPASQRLMTGSPAPPLRPTAAVQPGNRAVPRVEGTARDFSAEDVEMRLTQPRITLNGTAQSTTSPLSPNVTGSLVWLYLPGRGRYILSLVPRPELNFQKGGELRGSAITLTLGGDAITLESRSEIAPGRAPYNLYVLRDPEWEPTAQAQKGRLAIGSVDPGELAIAKRQ